MKGKRWVVIFATTVLALTSCAAFGQGNGHGKGHDKDKHDASYEYSSQQRESVNEWYRHHENNLPPGLTKRDQLPPGLEKQLQERGTLPPGLQKKIQPVPEDLEVRLAPLPEGCRHVIIGGHLVVLNIRTNYVYSVIHFEIE